MNRVLHYVERAWWFYHDNYEPRLPPDARLFNGRSLPEDFVKASLPPPSLPHTHTPQPRVLCAHTHVPTVFQRSPLLSPHVRNVRELLAQFQKYQSQIPRFGALLLSTRLTKVLLVSSYCRSGVLAIPKGKRAEDEEPYACACREVLEETDIDIRPHSTPLVSLRHGNLTVFVCLLPVPSHRQLLTVSVLDRSRSVFLARSAPSRTPGARSRFASAQTHTHAHSTRSPFVCVHRAPRGCP